MKKSFILLVAFAAMVFASCSKDDDDPSNEVGSITMTLDKVDIEFVVGTAKADEIITIDWGDGQIQEYKSVLVEKDEKIQYNIIAKHTYAQSGTHPIKISGIVTGLWCEYTKLITLDVSKCRALKELICYDNDLTALDVSRNKALTYISCGGNELTSLDVSKSTALTELYCSGNELTSLNVSECTALTELDCDRNELTTLDVSKCSELTDLSCSDNRLTTLDVSKCSALTYLSCRDNELTALDVSKCAALTRLGCSENKITLLDVSKCTALTYLNCGYNSLSSDALNEIFNDLPKGEDYEYKPKIYVYGNPGTETCDWSIFKNKGWEISSY